MSEFDGVQGRSRAQVAVVTAAAAITGARLQAARLLRSGPTRARGRSILLYALTPALSGVNAVVGLVLPALLGPASFGEYSLAVTLFQYGLIFDFGISQLIDRRAPVLVSTDPKALARFVAEALWVRIYIAALVMAGGALVLTVLARRGALPFGLAAGVLSLASGLSFMLALGPMAVDRATSRRQRFAVWSAVCASVLAVARPVGILLGGIAGCFGGLLACYAVVAGFLTLRAGAAGAERPGLSQATGLLLRGLPLFATSFVWAFYMTANRWVVSFLAQPFELGQFAFGSNMVYLIVGTVAALSQFYYPAVVGRAALAGSFGVSRAVARDLCGLALLMALPTAAGILIGPKLIELAYRTFTGSEGVIRIIFVAIPSLVVSSWLMPLSLSTATRPWIEGALLYPIALALLIVGTWGGYRVDGIAGAAWGLIVSAPALLAFQLGNLRLTRLLSWRDAALIFSGTQTLTVLLSALALWAGAQAGAAP